MKIYTKTGDKGQTSLVGGCRVSKAHPRVMTYGDVDELISWLALLRSEIVSSRCEGADSDTVLRRIQIFLMNASAHLAAEGESEDRLKPLDTSEIGFLESEIDRMTAQMPPQTAFVLPGAPRLSAMCHIARTVCRRAERSAVQIEHPDGQDLTALSYINRLSDYLFTLARYAAFKEGVKEDFWLP